MMIFDKLLTNSPLKVIIADDHPVARLGARALLTTHLSVEVVGEASDGRSLIQLAGVCPYDVVVLDLDFPDNKEIDPISLILRLRQIRPQGSIVVYSIHRRKWLARRLISVGVLGVVDKTSNITELPAAVLAASKGHRFLCPRSEQVARTGPIAVEKLSRKEEQVLSMLAAGHSLRAISELTFRSPTTISQHKAHAMAKLEIDNDFDLHDFLKNWVVNLNAGNQSGI